MTALMAVMNCIVLHKYPLHALQPCSPVVIINVFLGSGYVILIMTVAMGQMKKTAVSITTVCCFLNNYVCLHGDVCWCKDDK